MRTEQVVEKGAEATTYVATVAAFSLWGLTAEEWAVTISAVVAAASFCVHLWATIRRDRREERVAKLFTETPLEEPGSDEQPGEETDNR